MKLILPILADVANGIFAAFLAGYFTETELLWGHFLIGILFALSPDLDAVPRLVQTGTAIPLYPGQPDHRDYMHYPSIFVLVGALVSLVNVFLGILFILATVLHFFNDTWGTGFGVKWLWPFSKKQYKWHYFDANVFSRASISKPHSRAEDKNKWINNIYLTLTPISLVEYGMFVLSIILLLLYL